MPETTFDLLPKSEKHTPLEDWLKAEGFEFVQKVNENDEGFFLNLSKFNEIDIVKFILCLSNEGKKSLVSALEGMSVELCQTLEDKCPGLLQLLDDFIKKMKE